MRFKSGDNIGDFIKFESFDNFNLYIARHSSDVLHTGNQHKNPYISFLINGIYSEENKSENCIINPGDLIYRPSLSSQKNHLGTETVTCFNIEIKPNFWHNTNSGKSSADKMRIFKKTNINILKLYCHFLTLNQNDILNIQGYECLTSILDIDLGEKNIGRAIWISKVIELINDEPHRHFSLDYISDLVNLHPAYLSRKFKEKMGINLSQYIINVRLEMALINILREKNKRLSDVCLDFGFYDQSHFTNYFKNELGVSPSKFKNLLKG